jgi:hypothetical protein
MSHTPGPWTIEQESGNEGEAEVIVSDKRTICWTADTWSDAEGEASITEEDRANGRLIAAAPELLAALKALVDAQVCRDDGKDCAICEDAYAAIAKAEGRNQS